MKLPRRVPWASLDDLDQVCTWIYYEDSEESKLLAIQTLSAWKATTALPHALDSTLSLLAVTQQDNSQTNSSSYLSLRQSYAAALIRLVNGLVDPLQLGVYARSIATIAAQLGLPAWLVELRHAATHEDLPSLELLRQASRESLTWLLNNYFLPILNQSTSAEPQPKALPPLLPLLKRYKTLVKATLRDASLRTRYKANLSTMLKEIEGWIADAKVAANIAIGGIDWSATTEDEDPREKWALDRLSDVLLLKSVLVPLSKKKRVFPEDKFYPPMSSISLWTPLLTHLFQYHPDLPRVLCERTASFLVSGNLSSSTSYSMCLARWAAWIVNNDDSTSDGLRRDIVVTLLQAMMPGTGTDRATKPILALLQTLCEGDQDLADTCSTLSERARLPPNAFTDWVPDDLEVMANRLNTLTSVSDTCDPRGLTFHIPFILALPDLFSLHSVLERNPRTPGGKVYERFGVTTKIHQSLEEVLVDPEIELVIVATPSHTHYEFTKRILESGKHVLVDKPVTATVEQARELGHLAKTRNLVLYPYQNARWNSDFLALKKLLDLPTSDSRSLGKIVEFESHYDRYRKVLKGTWKDHPLPANGQLYDLGTHTIDQALTLFGRPSRLTAFVQNARGIGHPDVDDTFSVYMHYPGTTAILRAHILSIRSTQLRFLVRGTKGSYTKYGGDVQESQLKTVKDPRTEIHAEGFGREPESLWGLVETIGDNDQITTDIWPSTDPGAYINLFKNLAAVIRDNAAPEIKWEEAAAVIEMVELAHQSSREGRTLDVPRWEGSQSL
ncbi:hypothetical protein EYR38_001120 [Pleurotus pulmonarius]|nr:hypothetical protein EYR38_001120 [Pleurotus pulmonarius]